MRFLFFYLSFSLVCSASEKTPNVCLFFGESFPANDQNRHLFTIQSNRPLSSGMYCEEAVSFFINERTYSAYTKLEQDPQRSVIYINQSLYLSDMNTLLCSLKAAIVQTMTHNYCYLAHLETVPSYQQRGCARFLMACLEKLVRERKCSKITTDAVYSAVGFYEKLGFVKDYERDSSYDRCVAMIKKIKGGCYENNGVATNLHTECTSK